MNCGAFCPGRNFVAANPPDTGAAEEPLVGAAGARGGVTVPEALLLEADDRPAPGAAVDAAAGCGDPAVNWLVTVTVAPL